MKNTRKALLLVVVLAMAFAMVPALATVRAQSKTVVNWFVGVGTGTDAAQIDVQNALVEKFNASQNEIELKINIAANNTAAYDALATLIAAGDAPDIVGPVGFSGANSFPGAWADLTSLVEAANYDLTQFPESLVNLYKTDEGLIGIPFATFPSLIFFNKDLFDEAELAYPPTEFGQPYVAADGTESEWNWDTLALLAKELTVDSNGLVSGEEGFDPTSIVQYGFTHQWGTLRADLSVFGGGAFYDAATGKVTIPDHWVAHAKWYYNGLWKDYSIPGSTAENSDLLKPSSFASGKVAMARVPFWYTCCIGDLKSNWDLAPVPAYNGSYHSPTDADTFRITKASVERGNGEAAFTVLSYLLGEGALDLLTVYGAYPARPDLQDKLIESRKAQYPSVTNWAIVPASLNYAAVPNHEYYVPNFAKVQSRFNDFRTLLLGDTGKDIDVDAELARLAADLETIIKEEAGN